MRVINHKMLIAILATGLATSSIISLTLAGEAEHPIPSPVQDPRFEFLQGLIGTWLGESGHNF